MPNYKRQRRSQPTKSISVKTPTTYGSTKGLDKGMGEPMGKQKMVIPKSYAGVRLSGLKKAAKGVKEAQQEYASARQRRRSQSKKRDYTVPSESTNDKRRKLAAKTYREFPDK